MTKTTKLTDAQEKALKMAESKGGGINHVTKAYGEKHGIAYAPIQTIFSLVEKGLLAWESYGHWVITDAGRAAIGIEAPATETPVAPVEESQSDPCDVCGEEINFCTCEQPAQPSELETLRAEIAQLEAENARRRVQVGDCMKNYEFEKKQHAITEQNAQELEAENARLQDENEFKSRQIENLANQRDALQAGMHEKDAAFNELMAERNQLRDALESAKSDLLHLANSDSGVNSTRNTIYYIASRISATLESE